MQAQITAFQNVPNPTGAELGGWRFKFTRNNALLGTMDKPANTPSATFTTTMVPGSYVVTAQRLSNLGSLIGPEVASEPLNVQGPAEFEAPLTVTLSL